MNKLVLSWVVMVRQQCQQVAIMRWAHRDGEHVHEAVDVSDGEGRIDEGTSTEASSSTFRGMSSGFQMSI